ncbi:MAG: VOC family protein [Myxococcota bacterium]|nr:VOC family protein [Myxococcota bacterium]
MTVQHLSHIGVCVADLETALPFYTEGLGFRETHRLAVSGDHAERLLEIPGLDLQVVYLERDGTCIELLHYASPGHTGKADARPMNARGLTHISLRTDDLEADVAALKALGGRVLDATRIENPAYSASCIFVTDPDGTRIELVERPGDPAALPGE